MAELLCVTAEVAAAPAGVSESCVDSAEVLHMVIG